MAGKVRRAGPCHKLGIFRALYALSRAYGRHTIRCAPWIDEALMGLIPKTVGVLSYGGVLCLGLSTEGDDLTAGQSERTGGQANPKEMPVQKQWGHFIQGDVMRVDHGNYFVKDKNGKNVRSATDTTTQVVGEFKKGDSILAKVN